MMMNPDVHGAMECPQKVLMLVWCAFARVPNQLPLTPRISSVTSVGG